MIFKWIFVLTLPHCWSSCPLLYLYTRPSACIRDTKVFVTWAILLLVLFFSSRQFEYFEIKLTWKQVIFGGVEGSWVTVECVSDDNDPCVHTHSRQAHACASSLLLNNYSERVTLNGFNEIRRRRGDVVARARDSNVTASSPNGPVLVNWIWDGSQGERLTDGKRLGLKRRKYIHHRNAEWWNKAKEEKKNVEYIDRRPFGMSTLRMRTDIYIFVHILTPVEVDELWTSTVTCVPTTSAATGAVHAVLGNVPCHFS